MRYPEIEQRLFARRRMGMRYCLDRVQALAEDLGRPQDSFRTVHVVGTNGKGSTARMLAAVATELGLRTGLNTSPHLLDYRERISIDGRWIPHEAVIRFLETYWGLIEKHEATFFEITTAMAAWYFALEGVDLVVAEAGLGGRLDATRILEGELTILTGIDIEHRRILGSTRQLIAREKLAIAGPGSTLVWGGDPPEIGDAVREAVRDGSLTLLTPGGLPDVHPALAGAHQLRNAALVREAALALWGTAYDDLESSFRRAVERVRMPGRLDLRHGEPDILFDVAHNPQAISALTLYLDESLPAGTRPACVVGFLCDKPYEEMAGIIARRAGRLVTTTPLMPDRKLDAPELEKVFRSLGSDVESRPVIADAVELGRELAGDSSPLVVAGSFYVVGEAMLSSWRNGWLPLPEGEERQALEPQP